MDFLFSCYLMLFRYKFMNTSVYSYVSLALPVYHNYFVQHSLSFIGQIELSLIKRMNSEWL